MTSPIVALKLLLLTLSVPDVHVMVVATVVDACAAGASDRAGNKVPVEAANAVTIPGNDKGTPTNEVSSGSR